MKKILSLAVIIFSTTLWGQSYLPTWESLDTRPTPEWFLHTLGCIRGSGVEFKGTICRMVPTGFTNERLGKNEIS
jgi:hypothetical protein